MPTDLPKSQAWQRVAILIPVADRSRLIEDLPLSTNLRHVLLLNRFRTLGELNGCCYWDIAQLRRCGSKCLRELAEAVQRLQARAGVVGGPLEPAAPAKPVVQIPRLAHGFKLSELPMSSRLEGVLKRRGYTTLGDADGVPIEQLLKMKNCGRKSFDELLALAARAGAGEFSPTTGLNAAASWQDMVSAVDAAMLKFPQRNRLIFWGRIHGQAGEPGTLASLGLAFGLTRERIRQIVNNCLLKIRRSAGPRLAEDLRACQWKPNQQPPPFRKRASSKTSGAGARPPLYEPLFYGRVFDALAGYFPVD